MWTMPTKDFWAASKTGSRLNSRTRARARISSGVAVAGTMAILSRGVMRTLQVLWVSSKTPWIISDSCLVRTPDCSPSRARWSSSSRETSILSSTRLVSRRGRIPRMMAVTTKVSGRRIQEAARRRRAKGRVRRAGAAWNQALGMYSQNTRMTMASRAPAATAPGAPNRPWPIEAASTALTTCSRLVPMRVVPSSRSEWVRKWRMICAPGTWRRTRCCSRSRLMEMTPVSMPAKKALPRRQKKSRKNSSVIMRTALRGGRRAFQCGRGRPGGGWSA